MLEVKEVQRILSQLEPSDSIADELCRKADHLRWIRSPHEALCYCDEAIRLAGKYRYYCLGVAYLHRWAVYYSFHNLPEIDNAIQHAIEDCEHARDAFELDGDGLAKAISMECLGLTYELLGEKAHHPPDPVSSRAAFSKALDTYGQTLGLLRDLEEGYAYHKEQSKLDRCRLLYNDIRERYFHVAGLNARASKPPLASAPGVQATQPKADATGQPVSVWPKTFDGALAGIRLDLPVLRNPIAAGHSIPTEDDYITEHTPATRLMIESQEYIVVLPGAGRGNELTLTPDRRYVIMPVRGNSMNKAGIDDGDYVILSSPRDLPPVPSHRDIVSVVIRELGDTYAMLKRFVMHRGRPTLQAESTDPQFVQKDFTPDEWKAGIDSGAIEISGILTAILKKATS